MKTSRLSSSAFTLIELLVVITIIAVLAGIALPVYNTVTERGQQTKALSNAKQLGLACKLFAGDYSGTFPRYKEHGAATEVPAEDANEALRNLIPDYVPQEGIFAVSGSGWTPNGSDGDTSEGKKLEAGENHWAYVWGMREISNPNFPLIADGFAKGVPGVYPDPAQASEGDPGFIWKSKKAIIIRCDMSGTIENVDKTKFIVKRGIGDATSREQNLFEPGAGWFSSDPAVNKVMNPKPLN